MKRLDEIKERLDKVTHLRGSKGFDARVQFESCAEADIDYLLSLNELYVNTLKGIRDLRGIPSIQVETMKKLADQALGYNEL